MVAIAEPSSTALELPTPWKRNAQPIRASSPKTASSITALPGCVVRAAQPREVVLDQRRFARPAQLEKRPLQSREVALAPCGFGNPQPGPVEGDHPAVAHRIEQDVVRVEVGMIQACAMEAGDQPTGFLPGRIGRGDRAPLG